MINQGYKIEKNKNIQKLKKNKHFFSQYFSQLNIHYL